MSLRLLTMTKYARHLVGTIALAFLSTICFAGPFTPGNLVVFRAGDGIDTTGYVPLFLDEYSTEGDHVQSVAMPTDPGVYPSPYPLLAYRNTAINSVEGLISCSQDGRFLLVPGYAQESRTHTNVIGIVGAEGHVDTTTIMRYASEPPRGIASPDGVQLWTATKGPSQAPQYITLGGTSSVSVCSNLYSLRGITIFEGQLYACCGAYGHEGVYHIGTGLPTSGDGSFNLLPGTETNELSSMQCVLFDMNSDSDPDLIYSVNDSGVMAKFSLVHNYWELSGTITGSYRRVTGVKEGTSIWLFAIKGATNLVSLHDTAGYNENFSSTTAVLLATAPAGTLFSGVTMFSPSSWTPTPAPPTILVQPTNQFVAQNATVTFRVVASGYPPPRYQWLKNNINLAGETNASLVVPNIQWADASSFYKVKVWNDLGAVTSERASIGFLDKFAFVQIQPVCYASEIIQEPGKSNLIVITHGWQKDEPELGNPIPEWVTTMADNIAAKVDEDWQIVPINWVQQAYAGIFTRDDRWVAPNRAFDNGKQLGNKIGKKLATQNWRHIHFIAHSAGGALIEEAARVLKLSGYPATIHETFLDPYWRSDHIGKRAFGTYADWSDCYFTFDDMDIDFGWTDGQLNHAHNVEISWLDPKRKTTSVLDINYPNRNEIIRTTSVKSSHSWPRDFYGDEPSDDCLGDYGFPLSKEGGGWDDRGDYPPGSTYTNICGIEPVVVYHSPPLSQVGQINLDSFPFTVSAEGVTINGQTFTITATPALPRGQSGALEISPEPASGIDGLPWIAIGVIVTSQVNYVSFEAEFSSANLESSLLTVYWNTNLIGVIDESVESAGYHPYHFALPATYDQGAFTLGFELDAISNTTSSVSVTNVVFGFCGYDVPIVLDTYMSQSSNAPVLGLTGASNFVYYVDWSSNLWDWLPYAVLVSTNISTAFEIPDPTNSQMFFRARYK